MDIKFYQFIDAEPEDVFMSLTNPRSIELWSSLPADMSAEEGYEFSIFDGDIVGRNIKVIENEMIQQEWYFGEENAEPSIATIKLHPDKTGTTVEVRHTNIPDEAYENINEGWREYYIGAIKHFCEDDE